MPKSYLLVCAFVFSVATLWIPYTIRMWSQGHYQFFPLLLATVAGLLWTRRHDISVRSTAPTSWILVTGIVGVAVLALFGQLIYSGLTGAVSTLLGVCVLFYGAYGVGGLWVASSVLWLLILAVPLPLGLDQTLILKMQFFASSLASQLLDGLGILHFREGVILVTEKSQFMTEEACSGVRSLFSSLAVVAVYSVTLRHAWGRVIFNLMQTVGWVMLGNAIRLVAVVVLADNVDRWYATGTGHELLGIVAFVFILGMVISTDALLTILIYGPSTLGFDESLELPRVGANAEGAASFPLQSYAVCLLTGILSVVGCVGLRVASVHRHAVQSFDLDSLLIIPNPSKEDLPPIFDGWQQVSFEHVERDVSTATLAKDSFVWKYFKGSAAVVISADCPWAEWHNLSACYLGLGWAVDADYFVQSASPPPINGNRKTQSELTMTKADRNGFVIFTIVDRKGEELIPSWQLGVKNLNDVWQALLQQMAASLGFDVEAQFAAAGLQLPATTIQMLTESPDPLTDSQLNELRQFYDQIRDELLKSRRWTSSQTPAATP